jgi:hypothetical protein
MNNKNEIIEFCKNNRTSQRELMTLFGFKHRQAVTKFLKENNITINPLTEEDRRQRILDAKEKKRLEEWKRYDVEEIRKYCKNNSSSEREIESKFHFPSRTSVRSFLKYHDIKIRKYTREELNNKIKETHNSFSEDKKTEILEKRKESMVERYGVEHSLQSEDIKNKTMKNNSNKYGHENPFQVQKFKEKANDSMIEKYGVKHSFEREEVREKSRNTCLERYGTEYVSQNKEEQMKNLLKSSETLRSRGKDGSLGEQEVRKFITDMNFVTEKKYIPIYEKGK